MPLAPDTIGSYWEASVEIAAVDPCLETDLSADVAVIGAGYTGLSAALRLAEAGVSVAVLDAKSVGWGASGRNGGFCCFGGTKLPETELIRRFGLDEAKRFVRYQIEAIETVKTRLDGWGIDADRHSDGEIILAHRPRDFAEFSETAELLARHFGYRPKIFSREALKAVGIQGPEFFGGLHVPFGFALNPMKYVLALADQARAAGAKIHAHSPVTAVARAGAGWRLKSPRGSVHAQKVILAGNGYASEDAPRWLAGRTLPVMSSILVTRPLTESECAGQGWTSDLMAADTRTLLHYFRLLPDRRFLFGTRGGIFETKSALAAMKRRSRADFERMFPAWAGVETAYFWSGHVCLARRLTPFVGPVPEMDGVVAAMAWHGSGIAMASLSGEKAADLVLGRIAPHDLPAAMAIPFARFPLPALRRAYLQAAYWWYGFKDR